MNIVTILVQSSHFLERYVVSLSIFDLLADNTEVRLCLGEEAIILK